MKCNKCDSDSTIILRKKDLYCDKCFLTSTNHKFRACIGKNKILSKNNKVMVCLSGGPGSTVLLDLIHHGISLDIHKKLRIIPYFLHVTSTSSSSVTDAIKAQCEKYNFKVCIVHISNYLQKDLKLISKMNNELNEEFLTILKSMPSTACNDFLNKVKRSLFIRYAQLLDCKYVFTAETTSTLAVNLLSNLAIGRGSQVENDIVRHFKIIMEIELLISAMNKGFTDSRDQNVKILRPMKDISKEELDQFLRLKNLMPVSSDDFKSNSLQTAISSFVTDLQENFQSTISAICRTADKIGIAEDDIELKKCTICESNLNNINNNLSALEATIFSRTLSHGNHDNGVGDRHETLFPYINEHLCYSCSRNYSEMTNTSSHLQNIIQHY